MASNTAWSPGRLTGSLAYAQVFNAADLNGLPNGSTVMSSAAAIANATALDQFFDVSMQLTIASSTIVAGANLVLFLMALQGDGTTYGDGSLVAGVQAAITPGVWPKYTMQLRAGASQTLLVGTNNDPLVLPPRNFLPALQNNSGFPLAASGNAVRISSYNFNLNS